MGRFKGSNLSIFDLSCHLGNTPLQPESTHKQIAQYAWGYVDAGMHDDA